MRRILSIATLSALVTALTTPVAHAEVSYAATPDAWTHVNQLKPATPYGQPERLNVGAAERGIYRSLFRLDVRQMAGARITSVKLNVRLDHTTGCQHTPVLWQTKAIDPSVPLTWNSSRGHWVEELATAPAQACDTPVSYRSDELTALVQQAADGRAEHVSLGLRARQELSPAQGKTILPKNVHLVVTYNNPPDAPKVALRAPRPCGTADAPSPATGSVEFTAVASDPDGDHVTSTLEIRDSSGAVVFSREVGPTTSGAAFSWGTLPSDLLQHGQKYSYVARSRDATHTGPDSPVCHLLIDRVPPRPPVISSIDYPGPEQPVIPSGTTGTITLKPSAPGDDVYGYRFGLRSPERATNFVKAGPDGTAVVPVTLPRDNSPFGIFFASAVDRAGLISDDETWDLAALDPATPQPHVRNDLNGDGRADVTFAQDHGFGRMVIWNATAKDGGFHAANALYDTGFTVGDHPQGGPHVRGDFNGDGWSDLVLFRVSATNGTQLHHIRSDGNDLGSGQPPWSGDLPLEQTRFAAGDFDGDGRTDVAAATGSRVLVFRGAALGSPATWLDGVGSGKIVADDFDGDGKADLAEIRDDGGSTSLRTYASSGTGFGAGEVRWQGNDYRAGDVTPVSADVDGDGRGDVVAASGTALVVHTAADFTARTWWSGSLAAPVFTAGDFDLDGKEDVAAVRAADGRTQLWTWRSSGGAFGEPVLGWEDETRGTPTTF